MTTQLIGRDLYIRTTQPSGATSITQHRVWDGSRFLAAQQADALKRAEKDKCQPDVVTLATKADYRASR